MATAATVDPLAALVEQARAVEATVREADVRVSTAEKERDEERERADALQKEKDDAWKAKIETTKKLHPGQTALLKMYAAATREEWVEIDTFLKEFDGHLPVGLARIALGADALLNGADPTATKA